MHALRIHGVRDLAFYWLPAEHFRNVLNPLRNAKGVPINQINSGIAPEW